MSKKGDAILFGRTQSADQTPFDNSSNGFVSTDVQSAIEEAEIMGAHYETHLDKLIVMNESRYVVEGDRLVRVLSTDNNRATIVEGIIEVKTTGKTIIESGTILRVTA